MAYKFKLETVITYRQNLEDLAREKLVREEHILKNHIERLARLKQERQAMIDDLEERKKKSLPASLFSFFMDGIQLKENAIQLQDTTIESQRQVVERVREDLQEKVKARKVIEKAKERDYQNYLKEYLRREQNESDEMAILRFGRNHNRAEKL